MGDSSGGTRTARRTGQDNLSATANHRNFIHSCTDFFDATVMATHSIYTAVTLTPTAGTDVSVASFNLGCSDDNATTSTSTCSLSFS